MQRAGTPASPTSSVVFRSEAGEEVTVIAGADWPATRSPSPRGRYHAFVRDGVGACRSDDRMDRRLPSRWPSADVAGVADEGLMPIVVASQRSPTPSISASCMAGPHGSGDRSARREPVAGVAVVRARAEGAVRSAPRSAPTSRRPDAAGKFELHMPSGSYALEATPRSLCGRRPARRRGSSIAPGEQAVEPRMTLTAG